MVYVRPGKWSNPRLWRTVSNVVGSTLHKTIQSEESQDDYLIPDTVDNMCEDLWERLSPSDLSLSEFLASASNLVATAPLTDEDIVAAKQKNGAEENTDEPLPPPPPTTRDALVAISTLRSFLESCDGSDKLFTLDQKLKSAKQSKITEFFVKDNIPK